MQRLMLILLCPFIVQAQFTEDFSSGSLTNWNGDSAHFEIDSMHQLHLNAPSVADEAFLWHPSSAMLNAQWVCTVRMDFNPSGSNLTLLHLANDNNNGYFVKLGGAEDAISLYRNSNGNSSKIIEGPEDFLDQDSVLLQVRVLRDSVGNWELLVDSDFTGNYSSLGSVFDDTYLSSSQFGIQCVYTQSRSDKFYFDNILVDGAAFLDTFPLPQARQLVINELMIDPEPPNDLPQAEYVELLNISPNTFNLSHLQLADASSQSNLPHYFLAPNEAVILCDDLADFPNVESAIALNLPALNNAGDSIRLWLHDSLLIDEVNYSDEWHTSATEGGVSLELINPFSNCTAASNWASSTHLSGGTPAQTNSVFNSSADKTPPQILLAEWHTDTLFLVFDEGAIIESSSIGFAEGSNSNWQIHFEPALEKNQEYSLLLNGLSDCEGNEQSITISFIVPAQAEKGDIILNEILFNPLDGGNDFIEIYNPSKKYIDLKGWALANRYAGEIANAKPIREESLLISPQEIWVLCKDVQTLLNYHPTAIENRIIEMPSLPAYNNDAGTVYLLSERTAIMDTFSYSEEMHFNLLNSFEGVSLERISHRTNEWHSASENTGFSTPSLLNSQNNEPIESTQTLKLSPKIFSPNNDGEDDLLQIQIELVENGLSGSVQLFNTQGVLLKTIANNVLFGSSNTFYWDGLSDNGAKAPIGRYIVLFSAFNMQGKIVNAKKTCVLGGQL